MDFDQMLEDMMVDIEMSWITIDWWTMVNRTEEARQENFKLKLARLAYLVEVNNDLVSDIEGFLSK